MPTYNKGSRLIGRRGGGRPSKRTKELEEVLFKAIDAGAPFALACSAAGVSREAFINWRRQDLEFAARVERAVADCALRRLQGIEKHGKENFAALCWLLERRHPELFGRPEIQLNLIQQNNTVENHLSINITQAEATEIELQAQPIREAVAEMFRQCRPSQSNGNAEARDIEASPAALEPEREPPPISHCDTDAQNPLFWRRLVNSAPESKIAKQTAVFAIRAILMKLQGYKAHRMPIDFDGDPVTVEEVFSRLEKLCGGASAWQLAQKLGGY